MLLKTVAVRSMARFFTRGLGCNAHIGIAQYIASLPYLPEIT
jgi:hypothetical protein